MRYYWLKLQEDFFDRPDIKVIEGMENGKDYIILYLKMMLKSVADQGRLRLNERIPFNDKSLAAFTGTNIDIIRSAMQIFAEFGLVEITEDKTLVLPEVEASVGSESDSAGRMRLRRSSRQKELKPIDPEPTPNPVRSEIDITQTPFAQCAHNVRNCDHNTEQCAHNSEQCDIDIDIELEKEKEKEKEKEAAAVKPAASLSQGEDKRTVPFDEPESEISPYLTADVCQILRQVQGGKAHADPEASAPPMKPATPPPRANLRELDLLRTITMNGQAYPYDEAKDNDLIGELKADYPAVDIVEVIKDYRLWLQEGKRKGKGKWTPRMQLRNFVKIANERVKGNERIRKSNGANTTGTSASELDACIIR